ncbi:MAG TPA: rRNA maturation RNase YbeY [Spirochaetia bacterium]|nr:rRNA maturation RNase YbeY [Spirochaetia bacterium]
MKEPAAAEQTVEVAVDGVPRPRWSRRLASFCGDVLQAAGASAWELSVLLCGDERMTELNKRYRGKDRTTDVLSFPRASVRTGRGPRPLQGALVAGDIAISLPTMQQNAREFGSTDGEELKRLLVHGILHLAGMDHGRGKGAAMMTLQGKLLAALKMHSIIAEGSSRE